MKMPAEPDIDLTAPRPGANDGKGRLEQVREPVEGGFRLVWRCICGGCGRAEAATHNTHDAAIVTANLKRRGWRGFGKRIRCPACLATARKPATRPHPVPASMPATPERPVMCSAPADLINAARIGQYLEIYWQDNAGRYDDGWDDGRVGKELGGIAPDFVRRVREGLGKVPKRPAEIVEAERLCEEMKLYCQSKLDAARAELARANAFVNEHEDGFNRTMERIRVLLDKAEAKAGKVAA
ncbi:hypothetical protein [Niveispirillum sp.]|uniref:hypothetical protein n=1 Tax=Niveispirillum sp. TaxID=1917217 RepID=UPI001B42C0C5|nr:hypothetical protein [Niveispirillum sp.]MBP7336891.1 hypothetical protein [Niveispirillum sp.]